MNKLISIYPDEVTKIMKYNIFAKKEIKELLRMNDNRKKTDKDTLQMLLKLQGVINTMCEENRQLKDDNEKLKQEAFHLNNIHAAMSSEMSQLEDENVRLSLLSDAHKFTLEMMLK